MSRRKRLALILVLFIGCSSAIWLRRQRHAPLPPLQIGLWYWHHPFALPQREAQQLRAAGVTQLYIRAGTFIRDQDSVRMALRQHWKTGAPGLETHLVFNFDYSVVRGFAQLNLNHIAHAVSDGVRQMLAQARQAGLKPVGVQFDFDCATRSLPRYAGLLRQLRSTLVRPDRFARLSITALPTWYSSRDVRKVADAVDFMTPQYYEPRIGPTLERYATISCLPLLQHGMQEAERIGHPFYVGIPAYGHALMYDDHGSLVGLYRGLTLSQAAHHRAFRLARSYAANADGQPATPGTACGENLIDFVAAQPAASGRGLGYHLIFDLPTPDLVARHLALIRAERPPECRGVILFCYPDPDSGLALPLPSLLTTVHGNRSAPRIQVRVTVRDTPWELIETGRRATTTLPRNVMVSVTNAGDAGSFVATDALTLTLHFDRPGVEDLDPCDFDGIETAYGAPQSATSGPDSMRCSLSRANTLIVRRFQLAAGETARFGPIRIPANGPNWLAGAWTLRAPDGFGTLNGGISPISLDAHEQEH